MGLDSLNRLVRYNVKSQSPLILSGIAGVGVLATAFLASKATVQAVDIIRAEEAITGTAGDKKQLIKERVGLVWKIYIPPTISAVGTIACIVGSNRISSKKIFAAQTAFAVSERVYSEYRDKVIQEYGEKKDQSYRDSIAQDRVKEKGPAAIVAGSGAVLCCELYSMRYFTSDMETLRKAQNDINKKMLAHDYATFSDFYYEIGLSETTESSRMGWTSSRLMDLEFSTVLSEDGRPCIAFDYNYKKIL